MAMPTKRTPELVDEILMRLACGEPLAQICRDPHMPDRRTFNRWVEEDEALKADKQDARDDGHDEIAQRARMTLRGHGPDKGGESTGDVQRDKAIAEFDLKLLSKWDRRYADRVVHGGDAENPIAASITVSFK